MARIGALDRWCIMRGAALIALVFASSIAHGVVLDPPQLRCASVNPAGDVDLTWVVPPDPGGDFASYQVWSSAAGGGPYALAGTILVYGQTSFLHLGAGANAAPRYYYMTTVSTGVPPDTSIASDTLATLFLTVTQSAPLGSALLDWTPQHVPPLSTSAADYGIWLEYPQGSWQLIGSVPNTELEFDHVISICDDTLTYRIGLVDALGCVSFSNAIGDWFADATPPSSPIMAAVSVDTLTGLATLDWDPSPEPDTDAYIIVQVTPGGNVILDTVYGQFNTSYTWPGSNASFGAESFTVAAFDTCWTGTPPSPNTSPTLPEHTTVFASTTYDKCNARITVNWSHYEGWTVGSFQLFGQQNGGAVYLLATLPATTHSYVHTSVDPFATYCYVVKALRDGGGASSLSNKTCRITDYPPVPTFNYIRTVHVIAPGHVQVIDSVDMSAVVRRYRLERSANGEPWEHVGQIGGAVAPGPLVVFDDTGADTDARSYLYRVQVDDSCDTHLLTSNDGTSILLRATADLAGINHLVWNGYEDWDGAVTGYAIWRSMSGLPYTLLTMNPPDQWWHDDPVSDLWESNGSFCYFVEAIEGGNSSGINATSRSNVSCAIQEESVYIPNAFIAGSAYNSTFHPVTAFTDFSAYEFTIFNRWGQEIWTTSDPAEPWTGEVNGNYVPQGVYGYYCAIRNGAGKEIEKRGTVTFIYGVEGE